MSIEESYKWAKQQRAEWEKQEHEDVDLNALTEFKSGEDKSVRPVEFSRFSSTHFAGEVGVVGEDLIFHFFPGGSEFPENFADDLGDAFLEVFKLEERLCWDFVPELHSWVVRAAGYGQNLSRDELSNRLFTCLQAKLGE